MKATVRLFKALEVKEHGKVKFDKDLTKETVKHGFVFSPEVVAAYSKSQLLEITESIGLSAEQMNSSFHKSWLKVRDASIEQLVLEQIIHYFTTYGFENLGIYDENSVYIPNERLDIPDIKIEGINLVVVKGYTKEEFRSKLLALLNTGIALKEETIQDVVEIAIWLELTGQEIDKIKNKEVKVVLFEMLDKFPENPVEFLRYIVYRSTGKTLLIKNEAMIEEIRSSSHNLSVLGLLTKYKNMYGLERLAAIFYRFKPLFLAFKVNGELNTKINKIRKLAIKNHEPMPKDFLNEATAYIKSGKTLNKVVLEKELSKVNIFRKIRLAYALKYRTLDVDSILYRIRNGKSYATKFEFYETAYAKEILDIVSESIVRDLSGKVKGKKIYIPEYIKYALPTTEKQFTGNFPSGTCVTISDDMIFGIHWKNIKKYRIDLDLSLIDSNGKKIGWDGAYRSDSRDILFSGDITDAPGKKGASELFYVQNSNPKSMILFVNYYNYNSEVEAPFQILVAKEKAKIFGENYMVNPNNVLATAEDTMTQKQRMLGLVEVDSDGAKFYFAGTNFGNSISSRSTEHAIWGQKYLQNFYTNMISLNQLLEQAGVELVDTREEADIDLSPESLEKDTIINLLTRK